MTRKKNRNTITVVLALLLLVAIGGIGYMATTETQPFSVTGENEQTMCQIDTEPALTINSYDARSMGSSLAGIGLYRKVGTTSWNNFVVGSEISGLEANEEYEFAIGLNTSDAVDNNFGEKFSKVVKCQPSETMEKEMSAYEDESGLTATFYNADGDASAETFTAGQTQDVEIKFQAGVDEFFGNRYLSGNPNVLCMDLNSTAWDEPESIRVDGQELSKVSTPKRHAGVTGKNTYCYEAPIMDDADTRIVMKLNADDSNAPAVDDTAYLYSASHYVNSNSGELESGVEDEEGNAVSTDSAKEVTLDFTA